jgi:glutamyl-tRNA synthetase
LGNLRTAVLAWLFARSSDRRFRLRIDDLDPDRSRDPVGQLATLAALGISHDGAITYQSRRTTAYAAALDRLSEQGLVYECFCTRREIAAAPTAPHHPPGAYPGTCRELTPDQAAAKRASGRIPALRLRAQIASMTICDELHGSFTGGVDDLVLRRTDGVHAYNLAVVVDDHDSGVDQVVRGDDLLASTPRQAYLYELLGYSLPSYVHVPLVVNLQGERLAKRDGPVTPTSLGLSAEQVLTLLGSSLGLCAADEPVSIGVLLDRFDRNTLRHEPWAFDPTALAGGME